jgi:hypothetical protein
LLNGKMDAMMYEYGELVTGGLSLPELKEQAHINSAARSADDSRDFSKLIREGRVGFIEKIEGRAQPLHKNRDRQVPSGRIGNSVHHQISYRHGLAD